MCRLSWLTGKYTSRHCDAFRMLDVCDLYNQVSVRESDRRRHSYKQTPLDSLNTRVMSQAVQWHMAKCSPEDQWLFRTMYVDENTKANEHTTNLGECGVIAGEESLN